MKEQSNEHMSEKLLEAAEKRMQEREEIRKLARKLKLKPCPFCGGKAEIIENSCLPIDRPARYYIGCVRGYGCVVHPSASYGDGGYIEEIPELAEAWNRRYTSEHHQR